MAAPPQLTRWIAAIVLATTAASAAPPKKKPKKPKETPAQVEARKRAEAAEAERLAKEKEEEERRAREAKEADERRAREEESLRVGESSVAAYEAAKASMAETKGDIERADDAIAAAAGDVDRAHPRLRFEHGPVAAFSAVETIGPDYVLDFVSAALGYRLWFPPGVELAAGGRFGSGGNIEHKTAFEGWLALSLAPRFDWWHPSLGIEGGVTSVNPAYRDIAADDPLRAQVSPGIFYAQWIVRPLRARFWHLDASVLGVGLGMHLREPGRSVRFEVQALQVGFVL